jgi:hypothetical protein
MVSYTDPFAPTIEHPVGLDREIQRLQLLLLAELSWLQLSYGKAYRGSRKVGSKVQYYPEVYAGEGEYRDVLPNDNVQSQAFFYPTGPAVNPEREPIPGTLGLRQPVDIIFWANLQRIDPTIFRGFSLELGNAESALRQPYAGFRVQLELAVPNVLCEAEFVPSDALRLVSGGYLKLRGSAV